MPSPDKGHDALAAGTGSAEHDVDLGLVAVALAGLPEAVSAVAVFEFGRIGPQDLVAEVPEDPVLR
jgi:hypothetical protein